MKSPPDCLPAAKSHKWQNRRSWDPIGYYRVHTLANPSGPKDPNRLLRHLQRPAGPSILRDLMDAAIEETKTFRSLRPLGGATRIASIQRRDAAWDIVLARIDDYLEEFQRIHLMRVDEAGVSGRPPRTLG